MITKKISSPNIDIILKTNLDKINNKATSKTIIKYNFNLCDGFSLLFDNSGKKRAIVTIMIIAISPMPRSMSITQLVRYVG